MMIDQAKVRVLLLESIHRDAVSRLEAEGYSVESVRNALDESVHFVARYGHCSADSPECHLG